MLLDKENLGVAGPSLFAGRGRKHLAEVRFSSAARQYLLQEHMRLLEQLQEMIKREDSWLKELAQNTPQTQLLMTIPGIGELSALMILAELGDITRFRRSAQVVAYAGLAPSIYSSADTRRTGP